MIAFTLLTPLVLAASASAHGILFGFRAGGRSFGRDVIRSVSSQDPNRGAFNPALTCGPNARPNTGIAEVPAGAELEFDWKSPNGQNWPHNTGPMMTYLAECDGPCNEFDASRARWFKIDQVGRKPNSGEWFQGDMMNGAPARSRLPANLRAGNYLIRHEVLSLHLASGPQGAEFYPGCVQVRVTGTGTGSPPAELVSLPGAYNDNDPGILTPNVFNSGVPYAFPGPAVAQLGQGGPAPAPAGGNGNGNGNTPASSSPGAPAPTGSPAPVGGNNNGGGKNPAGSPSPSPANPAASPAPTKTCKLKKKRSPVDADTLEADNVKVYRPRHLSRVMRRLAMESH